MHWFGRPWLSRLLKATDTLQPPEGNLVLMGLKSKRPRSVERWYIIQLSVLWTLASCLGKKRKRNLGLHITLWTKVNSGWIRKITERKTHKGPPRQESNGEISQRKYPSLWPCKNQTFAYQIKFKPKTPLGNEDKISVSLTSACRMPTETEAGGVGRVLTSSLER